MCRLGDGFARNARERKKTEKNTKKKQHSWVLVSRRFLLFLLDPLKKVHLRARWLANEQVADLFTCKPTAFLQSAYEALPLYVKHVVHGFPKVSHQSCAALLRRYIIRRTKTSTHIPVSFLASCLHYPQCIQKASSLPLIIDTVIHNQSIFY